jgi:hypothetical protein
VIWRRSSAALVLLCVLSLPMLAGQAPDGIRQTEMVRIEGSKNPEQVPAYRAWALAFDIFAGGSRLLPTSMVEVTSKNEAAAIFAEADAFKKRRDGCDKRLLAAREPLAQLEATKPTRKDWIALARKIDPVMWEIELACRWEILHARDRLVEKLTPETRLALETFVESQKAGTSFTVPKNGLDRFRQPQ